MYYENENVWNIINSYIDTYKNSAKTIDEEIELYIVELSCDLEERYKRNVSENRLLKKPSKKDVVWTKNDIDEQVKNRRIVANEDEVKRYNAKKFIRIDNTNLSAKEAATIIKRELEL